MPTRLTLGLSKLFSETCSRNSTILTQPHTTFMLKSSPPRWHGTKGWEPLGGHTGGAHRNGTSVLTAEAHGTQVSIVDDRAGPPQKYLDFDLPAYTVVRIKYLLLKSLVCIPPAERTQGHSPLANCQPSPVGLLVQCPFRSFAL